MRKTDNDIKEVISQVKKILQSQQMRYFVQCIYGCDLRLTTATANEISTNLSTDIRGTSQLVGLGMGGSLTGKHFDCVFTDDIVNVNDRISRAERDRTKMVYQELQNIRNRGGRIYNTGTPWHKDDAFTLMPNIERFDCYQTGLIPPEDLEQIKESMTASLFAANYELRHVAEEDVIFSNPRTDCDPSLAEQGDCHIDAAYGGEDYTAFTIVSKRDGNYYFYGRLWRKHVDDCLDEIQGLRKRFNAGKIYCEDNGDKGYLAKELRKRGERAVTYHENMNKFLKITSYLKAEWGNVYFVTGTDKEFIDQICDFIQCRSERLIFRHLPPADASFQRAVHFVIQRHKFCQREHIQMVIIPKAERYAADKRLFTGLLQLTIKFIAIAMHFFIAAGKPLFRIVLAEHRAIAKKILVFLCYCEIKKV